MCHTNSKGKSFKTDYKTLKTDSSHQKQFGQHEDQHNGNNQKTKMGRKTSPWTFKATNKRHLTRENVDVHAQLRICLKNKTHKLLQNFRIQTDQLILARQSDLVIINKRKRTGRIVDFSVPAEHRVKFKENENKCKYLDLAREHENDSDADYNWCFLYSH